MNTVRRLRNITVAFAGSAGRIACIVLIAVLLLALVPKSGTSEPPFLPNNHSFKNPFGTHATFSTTGIIDLRNEFFQKLGTNGRSCVTCHMPQQAWSITPAEVQRRFARTGGKDPIFRSNDGANSPDADVATLEARRAAYSMLLSKGVIRVGLPVPADAEFELVAADDPYGFASASEMSLFRRPLPSTNLKFLSAVMWDGRESGSGESIHFDLRRQANSATTGHAQGPDLTDDQRQSIVDFEIALFTAQIRDRRAGSLTARGAQGGPANLAQQEFYIGINDLFGDSETGAPFDPIVFNLYDAWKGISGGAANAERAAIARGQEVFNTKLIRISGVSGINDEAVFGNPPVVNGTCTTCHDSPNAGNHSVPAPLDLGLTDPERRTPDMPLYTLRNKITGEIRQTTDPGRALVTGRWKDIGRFKGPILRALAARPPYFHDGSAQSLRAVVEFYDERFGIGFTPQEKSDLLAFLRTL